jgi:hypothetical protein
MYVGEARKASVAPFLVGMPDSGVELLRLMLDAHPEVAIPGPTFFVPAVLELREGDLHVHERFLQILVGSLTWRDHHLTIDSLWEDLESAGPFEAAAALRIFYRCYAARFGKQRWGDSTHRYGYHMNQIRRCLPEAHFIHVIRDGRDAAVLARRSHSWQAFGDIESHAREWQSRIQAFRREAAGCPQCYLEVRYEDLVTNAEPVVEQICAFLQLSCSPAMLAYHERASQRLDELEGIDRFGRHIGKEERLRGLHADLLTKPPDPNEIGRWRRELDPEDIAAYQRIAGELLQALGYPPWGEAAGAR